MEFIFEVTTEHLNCGCVKDQMPCACCEKDMANFIPAAECPCGCNRNMRDCCMKNGL